jgi:hypothetical protein
VINVESGSKKKALLFYQKSRQRLIDAKQHLLRAGEIREQEKYCMASDSWCGISLELVSGEPNDQCHQYICAH